MQHPAVKDVQFYTAAGVALERGQPLVNGTTYDAELGGADGPWSSIQWKWDASIVITAITVESSNLEPVSPSNTATPDFYAGVRTYEAAANGWHPETAIASIAVAGGSAGTQLVHIGGSGARRLRAKVVVGATGGKLRGVPHTKS